MIQSSSETGEHGRGAGRSAERRVRYGGITRGDKQAIEAPLPEAWRHPARAAAGALRSRLTRGAREAPICGRYFLDTLPEPLADAFHVVPVPSFEPSYNVAPTQLMPIVVANEDERRMGPARWGLIPFWAKDEKIGYRLINARAETVAEKPAFRQAWQKRRCLVPASGFFEWQKVAGGKQPYALRPRDRGLLAFAGLWERWKNPNDEAVISYTIVTTRASGAVAPIHDRMPVIVAPAAYDAWLRGTPREAAELLAPAAEDLLEAYPVSRAIGSPKNNRPELIEPVGS